MEAPLETTDGRRARIDFVTGAEVGASPTRARLIETAERLFALHGADGVSLRRVSTVAAQHNNYAVQYHFGSKEGLLKAVFAHRLPRIDAMRSRLLAEATAEADALTVRALIEVLLRPLALEAQDPTSHYVTFVVRNRLQVLAEQPWLSAHGAPANEMGRSVFTMLQDRLDHLPAPLRRVRLDVVTFSTLFALASHELQAFSFQTPGGSPTGHGLSFETFVKDLFDSAAASLLAPSSDEVREALTDG
jgi:AcrR family transcriptional regulator